MSKLLSSITFSIFFLIWIYGCANMDPMRMKEYSYDPATKTMVLVGLKEYSNNVTAEIIDADNRAGVMKSIAEQIRPHSKEDSIKKTGYLSETGKITITEIGGVYYVSSGYGEKRAFSNGNLTASVTNTNANTNQNQPQRQKIDLGGGWWQWSDRQDIVFFGARETSIDVYKLAQSDPEFKKKLEQIGSR